MTYKPKPAGPKSIRELFHWLWRELTEIGVAIDAGGGGPGVSDHDDLTNVTPDQHHPKLHILNSHTDVNLTTVVDGDNLAYDTVSGKWVNTPSTLAPVSGTTAKFRFSTTLGGTPASGTLRVDTADQTLATELRVSSTTRIGNDVGFFWANARVDDYIAFWETVGDQESCYYQITSINPDQGGWYLFGVTFVAGTAGVDNNKNIEAFIIDNPASQLPVGGTAGQHLSKISATSYDVEWVDPPSGGSGATEFTIAQTAHGFAVLDAVRHDGVNWVKAKADIDSTTALGIVVAVADVNTFTVAMSGRYQIAGLTADEWYYLSDTVAGDLTLTEPGISQPIVYAEVGGWVIIYPYRPATVAGGTPGGGGGGSTIFIQAKVLIETITNVTAGEFDFDAIPPGYDRLSIRGTLVSNGGSTVGDLAYMYLNGDTTNTNYNYVHGYNQTGALHGGSAGNVPHAGFIAGSTNAPNELTTVHYEIENYAGSDIKQWSYISRGILGSADFYTLIDGFTVSSIIAAITRVRIRADNHPTNQLFGALSLYGEKQIEISIP